MNTQLNSVLRHLQTGATLTPYEALHEYGTLSLPYHIFKLRQMGFNIATNLKRSLNGKRYAQYRLVS